MRLPAPALLAAAAAAAVWLLLAARAAAQGSPTPAPRSTERARRFLSFLAPTTPVFAPSAPASATRSLLNFQNYHARPAAIVLAARPAHVADAVRCARRARFRVCARAGGHSLVGASLCSEVLVDVGPMREVAVLRDGSARVGAGVSMGELLWALWQKRRWAAAGTCPGIGFAGFVLGGGKGPYEGTLGMACDRLLSAEFVDINGNSVVASRKENTELFWSLCGAGGGQFVIATSFRIKTVPSHIYDRSVVFHVTWPQRRTGEVVHKWLHYDEHGGKVWFRLEQKLSDVLDGYGACFDISGVAECMDRLKTAAFFNVPGRNVSYIAKVDNALDMHAFYGPDGDWGGKRVEDVRKALLEKRYTDQGQANPRTRHSTFLRQGTRSRTDAKYWQRWADFCARPGLDSFPWVVCQVNLVSNAVRLPRDNSYPHRDAEMITHYIVGGGSSEHKVAAYRWMQNYIAPHIKGAFVNYPELELDNYAELYWGFALERLRKLKARYDPGAFFYNPQPIPVS